MEAAQSNVANKDSVQKNIFSEQIKILHKNLIASIPANFICASIVFIALYQISKNVLIWYWFIAFTLISLFRFLACLLYFYIPHNIRLHRFIFLIGITLSSSLWGVADSILMPSDPSIQMIIIVIIAGITAGGVQSLNARLEASIIYVILIVFPLCVWLFMQAGFTYLLLGFSMGTYLLFSLIISVYGHNLLVKALTLQYENLELLQKLSASNIKLTESYQQLEHHEQQLVLINKVNDMLQVCQDTNEAYAVIKLIAKELFNGLSGCVAMKSYATNNLEIAAQWGDEKTLKLAFTTDDCWALRKGQEYLVNDQTKNIMCRHFNSPPNSYICLPISTRGQLLGLLILYSSSQDILTEDQIHLIHNFNEVIQLSLMNIRLRESLYDQSVHDPLTGLFNRRYSDETLGRELQRVIREKKTLCVAMLDLDHFKDFNDDHGHEAGDEELKYISALFKKYFRESDVVCRFGGEEFLIVLINTDISIAYQRLQHIREEIKKGEVLFNGHLLPSLTISIGVAEAPMHGTTVMDIIHAADTALYLAKKNGRDRVECYNFETHGSSN